MRYFKLISDGLILSFGEGQTGTEITEEEYDDILNALADKPEATENIDYQLKEDLTWEPYYIDIADLEPTLEEKAESYDILIGNEQEG